MFPTKDGKSYGSRFVAKRKDTEHDKMGAPAASDGEGLMKKAAPMPEAQEPAQKLEGMAAPPEDPKQVVAKDGPAETIHIAHDHAANKHHVISTHRGKVHESEYGSAKEAHDAASQLSGGDQPMGSPAPTESDNAMFGDSFQTPKLA